MARKRRSGKAYLGPRQCAKCRLWFTPENGNSNPRLCQLHDDVEPECGEPPKPVKKARPGEFNCDVCTRPWKGKAGATRCEVCEKQKFRAKTCAECSAPFWVAREERGKRTKTLCLNCRPKVPAFDPECHYRDPRRGHDPAYHRMGDFYLWKYEDNTDFIKLLEENRGWWEDV